jgi:hypothetical protein
MVLSYEIVTGAPESFAANAVAVVPLSVELIHAQLQPLANGTDNCNSTTPCSLPSG